jgi:uncharacterized protein (TIGR02145 family)
MKKLITLVIGIVFIYSCSTSTDSNGNTTAVPVPPSNLTGTVASSTQINLSWTDNSTNETGFKIERKTGTGTYTVVGTTATNITTLNDTGLSQGTTYTYRVFSYNAGGNSTTYSNEITLNTLSTSVTDFDGNTYQLVTICNQIWTKSNLNVSHYRNGDVIPQVTNPTQFAGLSTGAWCYYNNNPANGTIYGKLYNWHAINDPRGLAPVGYHIPLISEITTLATNCLGEFSVTGGKLKQIGTTNWLSPNTGATNESNFTGLPGGWGYNGSNGQVGILYFEHLGYKGIWWTSSYTYLGNAYSFSLDNNSAILSAAQFTNVQNALSVRCIKD